MDIKVLAAPLDRPEAIDYMEELINEEQDPFWIMVNVNQLYKDEFPEKEILDLIGSIAKGSRNTLHIMQPKDNTFYYTDEFLQTVYRAWNSLGNVRWYQPSHIPEGSPEG